MNLLQKAIEIAVEAHKNQTRVNGSPYVLHPMRVMLAQTTDMGKIVGILHDVFEDSDRETGSLWSMGFPDQVVAALNFLTHKKEIPYELYIRNMRGTRIENILAMDVKIADLRDNMNLEELPDIAEYHLKRAEKYHKALNLLLTYKQYECAIYNKHNIEQG